MATSPNFGWLEPDNTDLVKNGALAIRTAVDAIDTSMADLLGGTTGQVLCEDICNRHGLYLDHPFCG
jgi:hypothetical protein